MQAWLQVVLMQRLLIVFITGMLLGHLVNWAIARFRIEPLEYHPWTRTTASSSKRKFWDYIPLFGWILRRDESQHFGTEFWVRPLCIELLTGFLFALLYWWETVKLGLIPDNLQQVVNQIPHQFLSAQIVFHTEFIAHAVLSLFLLAASFIDWDEQIIPDEITVVGTLLAMLGLMFFPLVAMPNGDQTVLPNGNVVSTLESIHFATPNPFPTIVDPAPNVLSLVIACACYGLWAFGLWPRVWYARYGFKRAWRYFWATVARHGNLKFFGILLFAGWSEIVVAWVRGSEMWPSFFSSIIGMFAGGMLIWLVRIVGQFALGREVMGFGDVTLMAMIGAVLGWQATILIFFLAPLPALVFGIIQWIRHSENIMPYGPFLCIATWGVIFAWVPCWEYIRDTLGIGWLIPAVMGTCVILIGVLLRMIRQMRGD